MLQLAHRARRKARAHIHCASILALLPPLWQTWRDPAAYDTVQRSTQAMLSGNYSCQKPCTDWVGNLSCCDGIFIPTFFFR